MKTDFINQLQALGYNPQEPATNQVYFEWTVPTGRNLAKKVLVGVAVTDAYPGAPPSAPHFKPLEEGWINHSQNVSPSNFGQGWKEYPASEIPGFFQSGWFYWSRGFDEWAASEKTAKFYLAHLKNLMMSL